MPRPARECQAGGRQISNCLGQGSLRLHGRDPVSLQLTRESQHDRFRRERLTTFADQIDDHLAGSVAMCDRQREAVLTAAGWIDKRSIRDTGRGQQFVPAGHNDGIDRRMIEQTFLIDAPLTIPFRRGGACVFGAGLLDQIFGHERVHRASRCLPADRIRSIVVAPELAEGLIHFAGLPVR
jgi:hypothetical protein